MKSPFIVEDVPGRRGLVSEFSSGSASAGALGAFFPRGARTGCAACSPLAGLGGVEPGIVWQYDAADKKWVEYEFADSPGDVYLPTDSRGNPAPAAPGSIKSMLVPAVGLAALGLGGYFIWRAVRK